MIITYPHRHRGPYEYDKHVLNALQLHNAAINTEKKLFDDSSLLTAVQEVEEQIENASEKNQEHLLNWLCLE